MADYGLKISKSGYDVKTATPVQLIFSSAFNTFKIVLSGSTSVSGDAYDSFSTEVTHDLNYVPLWLVFYKSSAGTYYKWAHGYGDFLPGDNGCSYPTIRVDTSELYISGMFYEDDETVYFYYNIFANQIET